MRAVGLTVLVMALLAAPASAATTLVLPDGTERPQPWQRYVDRARMPTPDLRVPLALYTGHECRGGAVACTNRRTIWIEGSPPIGSMRLVLLHEIGHIYIGLHVTTPDQWGTVRGLLKRRVRATRTRPSRVVAPYARASGTTDAEVEEVLADAYYACSRNGRRNTVYTRLYSIFDSRHQHRKLCRFLRRAAG